jgi:Zn-dependent peptidase ImmA (M78 family)
MTKEEINNELNDVMIDGLLKRNNNENTNYCYCSYDNSFYNNLSNLLQALGINTIGDGVFIEYFIEQNIINIPYIKREEIEKKASEILTIVLGDLAKSSMPVDLNKLEKHILKKHGIKVIEKNNLGLNRNGERILARLSIVKKTIEIDKQLDVHRRRFTLAHEIGHVLLHISYMINPLSETDSSILGQLSFYQGTNKNAEVQANIFAACLLMPKNIFLNKAIEKALFLGYKPKGNYLIYIDNQPWNANHFKMLRQQLSDIFNVSFQAIEYHLKDYGLLVDGRDIRADKLLGEKFSDIHN